LIIIVHVCKFTHKGLKTLCIVHVVGLRKLLCSVLYSADTC